MRALTDANSVSTTELTKLIDYYRGSRPNTIRWRDFVSDFAGISSESGTVSSRGRRTRLDLDVDPLERQLRKILSAAKKKGLGIEEAFDHFDEDKSGQVNRAQFRKALADLGFKARDRDMDALMSRLDLNGDGRIVSLLVCRRVVCFGDLFPSSRHHITLQTNSITPHPAQPSFFCTSIHRRLLSFQNLRVRLALIKT